VADHCLRLVRGGVRPAGNRLGDNDGLAGRLLRLGFGRPGELAYPALRNDPISSKKEAT